jgi:CheY-like chemotaxis protein
MPSTRVFLDADRVRFVQILQNLINNAAKYTPSGGTICIDAKCIDHAVHISIRDSGIGISTEQLPLIFGLFSQLADGATRAQGGLGIGLSLVKALTEQHGGTVSASSAGIGLGSEFVIRLPISADQHNAADLFPRDSATSLVQPRRILIVDDSEDAATGLAMLLKMDDHQVQTAIDGKTGLEAIHDFVPDTILLDIGLPDMTGYQFAERIRQSSAGATVLLVALTGWGQTGDREKSIAAGCDFHFTKPVDYSQLLEVLNRAKP